MIVKASLHIHMKGDPKDTVRYDWKELIDHAITLGFDILAITCHDKIVFPLQAKKYASKKNILLIKGIEIDIEGRHTIILNADKEAEKIKTFEDLKHYKTHHKESLIIAPHPYFPTPQCLKKRLDKHIDLFDAIEFNYFFTKNHNYNAKAEETAKRFNKPLVGTSDCHILRYLNLTFSEIETDSLNLKSLFKSIKENKIKIISTPLKPLLAASILLEMCLSPIINAYEKLFKTRSRLSAKKS